MTPEFEILLPKLSFVGAWRWFDYSTKDLRLLTSGELAPDSGEIVFSMSTLGPTAPLLNIVPEKLLISLLLGEVRELLPELMSS